MICESLQEAYPIGWSTDVLTLGWILKVLKNLCRSSLYFDSDFSQLPIFLSIIQPARIKVSPRA